MLKIITCLSAAAVAAAFLLFAPAAAKDEPANTLLLVPSETAFDTKFQDFLAKGGGKLLESYPPSVFVGYIPQELDRQLDKKYGAKVYREKVDDWASFAAYGEKAVFAVNSWNKRFVDDPPSAPLVVSSTVQKAGRRGGMKLAWNAVMKATLYRLQISRNQEFSKLELETLLTRNEYTFYPSFWRDGIYYWRVSARVTRNTGETAGMPFSEPYSFAISNPPQNAANRAPAPVLDKTVRVRRDVLRWPNASDYRYYRVQVADSPQFQATLLDVFTDTCTYRLSGLPIEGNRPHYMRAMGTDGEGTGEWSAPAELAFEAPPAAVKKRRVNKK